METTIPVLGLDCDSCVKAVSRVIANAGGAQLAHADVQAGTITVTYDSPEQLTALKAALIEAGYGTDGGVSKRGSISRPLNFFAGILSSNPDYAVERGIAEATLASLFILLALSILSISLPELSAARPYFPLLILSSFGISACYAALAHYRAFTQPFSCMSGMMVGMTIGMIGGFLSGSIVGAANGMFVGSVVGMGIGMGFGALAGKQTGAMGILEGLMAGVMSGTMGAMLSVMLFTEPLIPFLALLFAACTLILLGLSYLLFREAGSASKENAPSFLRSLLANTAFFILLSAFLIWGPRSGLTWKGA